MTLVVRPVLGWATGQLATVYLGPRVEFGRSLTALCTLRKRMATEARLLLHVANSDRPEVAKIADLLEQEDALP
jgi:hypothetical protein